MMMNKYTPIFIVAIPRSGTTMLASHLASSDGSVFALPEMPFIVEIFKLMDENVGNERRQALLNIMSGFRFKSLGLQLSDSKKEKFLEASGAYEVLEEIIDTYLEKRGILKGAEVWVEHSPCNRNNMELLSTLFPKAKFIHIVRDPRAVYSSMRKLARWNMRDPSLLSYQWGHGVGNVYRFASTHPSLVHEVKYEDILKSPRVNIEKICSFIGCEFQERMLSGGGVQLPKFTVDQHSLTMRSADIGRASAWSNEIEKRDAEIIEHHLSDWMKYYGYIENIRIIKSPTKMEKLKYKKNTLLHAPVAYIASWQRGTLK